MHACAVHEYPGQAALLPGRYANGSCTKWIGNVQLISVSTPCSQVVLALAALERKCSEVSDSTPCSQVVLALAVQERKCAVVVSVSAPCYQVVLALAALERVMCRW